VKYEVRHTLAAGSRRHIDRDKHVACVRGCGSRHRCEWRHDPTRCLGAAQPVPGGDGTERLFWQVLGAHPLNDYVVFILVGLLVGAFVAAWLSGELRVEVLRGPNISNRNRLLLALLGGILTGFAARLARGCTSGQGLVGGAELSVGAWVFLLCIFAGGWMAAWFVRKQWI
jgi:uncharacterized membrane protein YedE/YeeE